MTKQYSEKFKNAFELHKNNKLDEAEILYNEILQAEPETFRNDKPSKIQTW